MGCSGGCRAMVCDKAFLFFQWGRKEEAGTRRPIFRSICDHWRYCKVSPIVRGR
jgi:hypothetical protein